jgi:hypothetical protein
MMTTWSRELPGRRIMEVAVALAKVANPRAVASAGSICARSITAVTMAMSSSIQGERVRDEEAQDEAKDVH